MVVIPAGSRRPRGASRTFTLFLALISIILIAAAVLNAARIPAWHEPMAVVREWMTTVPEFNLTAASQAVMPITITLAIAAAVLVLIVARRALRAENRARGMTRGHDELLDIGGLAAWELDLDTGRIVLERRWYEMTGYSPTEIEPTQRGWASVVHPDDRVQVDAAFGAYLRGESPHFEAEHRLLRRDGSQAVMRVTGRVVGSRRGSRARWVRGIQQVISVLPRSAGAGAAVDAAETSLPPGSVEAVSRPATANDARKPMRDLGLDATGPQGAVGFA